jgi:hypothetical protein
MGEDSRTRQAGTRAVRGEFKKFSLTLYQARATSAQSLKYDQVRIEKKTEIRQIHSKRTWTRSSSRFAPAVHRSNCLDMTLARKAIPAGRIKLAATQATGLAAQLAQDTNDFRRALHFVRESATSGRFKGRIGDDCRATRPPTTAGGAIRPIKTMHRRSRVFVARQVPGQPGGTRMGEHAPITKCPRTTCRPGSRNQGTLRVPRERWR